MRRKCKGGSFLEWLGSPIRRCTPQKTTDYTKESSWKLLSGGHRPRKPPSWQAFNDKGSQSWADSCSWATAPADPHRVIFLPGSWKSVNDSPGSAVRVILSTWHHIWCQWFCYCFMYFISCWILSDEASHPQRQGVWRKNSLLSKS